jgi:hypothetical protein
VKLGELIIRLREIEETIGPDAEVVMTSYTGAPVRSIAWTRDITTKITNENPGGISKSTSKVMLMS